MGVATENLLINAFGYSKIFICAAMCYMPMMDKLKVNAKKLAAIAVPLLLAFIVIGSVLSSVFDIAPNTIVLLASVIFFAVYSRTLDADLFECLFVFIYVASLSCYPYHYTLYIDVMTNPEGSHAFMPAWVELIHLLFLITTAVIFYLNRKQTDEFADNLKKVPMKKLFWIVPFFFTAVLIMMIPLDYNTIYTRRIIYIYPLIITAFLALELLIVYLFRRIAREITNNEKLELENQTLEFQSKRYESLKAHIEQTARIRHDFRQQLRTISSFAENEKYDELKKYLSDYSESIAGTQWSAFCKNSAVDAIIGYYSSIAAQRKITTDWHLDLPEKLPVAKSVFCGMIGNLIENSINACEALPACERIIHLSARMPSPSIIAVVIENPFEGKIKTDKKGNILSARHKGSGIGLRSVQIVVEKYHGQMQMEHDEKNFRVSVLLNF